MKFIKYCFGCALSFCFAGLASGSGIATVNIDFVDVGDPGNPAAPVNTYDGQGSGYGAVDYAFRIGTYEVTNTQYTSFLNSVAATDTYDLYNPKMGSEVYGGITRSGTDGNFTYATKTYFGNKPVNYVTFFDGARLANWLQNGQLHDAATTEYGAYTFSGIETLSARNSSAQYFLPNEHEWKKAAFYEPGANTLNGDGWWRRFGAQDFAKPTSALVDEFGNVTNPSPLTVVRDRTSNWNGSEFVNNSLGNVATVGSAGSKSFYGAYDIAGNVFEWTEADTTRPDPNGWGPYAVFGGSFRNEGHFDLHERNLEHHVNHNRPLNSSGIRLAAAFTITTIPEPSSLTFASVTVLSLVFRRRSRK